MVYDEVLFFDVPQTPRGTFDEYEHHTVNQITVPCAIKSVTGNEFYKAQAAGIQVDYILVLSSADVPRQKYCWFNGRFFEVVRQYVTGNSRRAELTIRETAPFPLKIPKTPR